MSALGKKLGVVAVSAMLLFAVPGAAQAQFIFLGGGATIPTGDFGAEDGTDAKTGWMANAGFGIPIGPDGLAVGVEGFYGENKHQGDVDDKTNPFGAIAFLTYRFGASDRVGFFVYGGGGLVVHKFSDGEGFTESESKAGGKFGAGVDIPLGSSFGLWVDGSYLASKGTSMIGASAGIGINLGSNN